MDEIVKNRIRRALAGLGIRFQKYPFYKFPYDPLNFLEFNRGDPLTIFDVGGNIGQSALWFRASFPRATIHAFEPFDRVFAKLRANTQSAGIECHHLAFSSAPEVRRVPIVRDGLCQIGNIKKAFLETDETEEIEISTLDAFARQEKIERIDILKTDTEGHDLEVLRGGVQLFESRNIANVLAEASIDPEDHDHSQLDEMRAFLEPLGFLLYSLYDLNHNHETGRLQYFNALFKLAPRPPHSAR